MPASHFRESFFGTWVFPAADINYNRGAMQEPRGGQPGLGGKWHREGAEKGPQEMSVQLPAGLLWGWDSPRSEAARGRQLCLRAHHCPGGTRWCPPPAWAPICPQAQLPPLRPAGGSGPWSSPGLMLLGGAPGLRLGLAHQGRALGCSFWAPGRPSGSWGPAPAQQPHPGTERKAAWPPVAGSGGRGGWRPAGST